MEKRSIRNAANVATISMEPEGCGGIHALGFSLHFSFAGEQLGRGANFLKQTHWLWIVCFVI
jgi:hypothetical protein